MNRLDELIQEYCPDGVGYKTLGEIATDIFRGSGIKRDQVTEDGIPCVRYGEIYTTYGIWFDGDFLLVSEDGNNLVARSTPIAFSISGKNWVNNHAHVLKFDSYTTRRYVEFYLNSIDLSQYISGGAQPKLNQKNLNTIPIPLPSIKEQERIVGILDRFDALCNDISSGLPAEIGARTKQYEYYRDKLLTFKKQ